MSRTDGLNRRSFLKNAGFTALAGAVGSSTPLAAAAAAAADGTSLQPPNGKYDFDTVYNRFGTDSTKFDQQIRNYGKDSVQVGMGIADMDFRAAPAITEALQARMKHENWGYLDMGKATPALTERGRRLEQAALRRRHRSGHDGALRRRPSGADRRAADLLAARQQGPAADADLQRLLLRPHVLADQARRRARSSSSTASYSMDFDEFERRISHDTNSFILCNPQNPTGNCWSAEDLTRIGEICLRRRVVVLADEIHCDWVTKGHKYTPFASLPNKAIVNNSITFKAASKSFGLAAHKVAWFYSTNPELLSAGQGQPPRRPQHDGHRRQPGGGHRRRRLAESVRRLHRRQPRFRREVHRRQHPDDQVREAGGHLPARGSTSRRSPRRSTRRRSPPSTTAPRRRTRRR